MSLSAYLAKNYLNASASSDLSTRPKKRRKKDPSNSDANSGLVIVDDDLLLSATSSTLPGQDDEDGPMLESNTRSAEFRRAKKNNWKTLGAPAPSDPEQVEADRILAAAAEESNRARAAEEAEDGPAVVEDAGAGQMSSVKAGLQTAAETEAMAQEAERRKQAELKATKLSKKRNKDQPDPADETVYRDATGRRIDVSMKRAEARAAELEKLRQERMDKEDAMGEVQKRQKEERKEQLEEAKFLGVARHADDEEMNEELKGVIRWDDPMAAYMMKKQEEEGSGGGRTKGKVGAEGGGGGGQVARRKVYQGAAPPNRYGIKPGWRWDGVDRGNGFEKEWFQARGKKSRNEHLEYQWQMDE